MTRTQRLQKLSFSDLGAQSCLVSRTERTPNHMRKYALAPALAAALLTGFALAAWSLWPASTLPHTQTIQTNTDQLPAIEPFDCTPGSVASAPQEMSE